MDFGEVMALLLKLWPLVLLQFALMIWALVDLLRRRSTRTLSVPLWAVLIIIVNFFGPIAYFLFGRVEQ
ncbi:MAG: PLDc_N domain-containing protein [Firmicutes bacterium]|nr:PLDc_N domain-containing protein [Bacillota bacterium]